MSETPDLDALLGSAVYSFTRSLIAAGMTPARACALVGFAVMEGTLGREATRSLGLPRQTVAGWRREIAAVAESGAAVVEDPQLQADLLNELLPALGMRDLRVHPRSEEA